MAPGRPSRPPRRVQTADPDQADEELQETGPLRRCALTRERLPKERMIRFVVAPDGSVVPDIAGTLPGRGIWLSARADVLEGARTRGAFSRSVRAAVAVPLDLTARVQMGLERRITELLGLCRRAGQAVAGFDKAREWLREGRAALILQASDGSAEERRRFIGSAIDLPVISPLPGAALGAVFGRERTVHVAVAPGRLAENLRAESERLAGLKGPNSDVVRSGESRQAG